MSVKRTFVTAAVGCLAVVGLASCSSDTAPSSIASSSSSSPAVSDSELILDESYLNIIIDIRSPEEYEKGHVEGAVNVPYENRDFFNNLLVTLGKGELYVIYGDKKASAEEALESFQQLRLNTVVYESMEEASAEVGLPIVK